MLEFSGWSVGINVSSHGSMEIRFILSSGQIIIVSNVKSSSMCIKPQEIPERVNMNEEFNIHLYHFMKCHSLISVATGSRDD